MKKILILMILFSLTACTHPKNIAPDATNLTVGKVQGEIVEGMPASDVAAILGSPNIVTTDEERREVWIYDKFATETIYSESSGGVNILFLGGFLLGDGAAGGGVGGSNKSSSGASSKTQRTMTIIIKFGEDKRVRDFAYHSSSF